MFLRLLSLSPKPVFLETISIAIWEICISRDHLTDINWSHSRIKHCYNVWWIFWEICQKSSRTTVWLRISPWPPDLAACIFVGGSLNGGTQQPWVFLLKMIILGCLGGTTIEWNTHIYIYIAIDYWLLHCGIFFSGWSWPPPRINAAHDQLRVWGSQELHAVGIYWTWNGTHVFFGARKWWKGCAMAVTRVKLGVVFHVYVFDSWMVMVG